MSQLEIGQTAPDFSVETPNGTVTLTELLAASTAGVVVYFYPKANTPGCTKEACDFRDNLAILQTYGYQVIGISPDQISALEKFATTQNLNFPLGADPDYQILEAYGAWGAKNNYGRQTIGVIRSTIVVDKDGKVALARYNVKATGHVERLKAELGL